jgi:hypothetical protein
MQNKSANIKGLERNALSYAPLCQLSHKYFKDREKKWFDGY